MASKNQPTDDSAGGVKTPRDAKGPEALKILEKTSISVYQSRIPPKGAANAKHCHTLKAQRDVKRIDRQAWEARVGKMHKLYEQHRFDRVNALHKALGRIKRMLSEARARERTLQTMTGELERTSAYLQTLMDAMADVLIATDRNGAITEVNRAAETVTGYSRSHLMGRPLADCFTEPQAARSVLARVITGEDVFDLELALRTRTGPAVPVLINATALGDATEITGALFNARDMTELKRAEQERQQYALELARANADLEEFAALASHELKEPLKKVAVHAGNLMERYRDLFERDALKDLSFLAEQAAHMQNLIANVLDYARVDTGEPVRESAACSRVLAQALRNLEGTLEASPVRVTADPMPEVQGDFGQLVRVFQNLIGNALKYFDPQKDEPRLHLSWQRAETARVALPPAAPPRGILFSFEDNGIGIDPEFQEDIFKMFVRLHPREKYSGEGMGLAICRRIIRRHSGEIWLESALGQGSTFYFVLPDPI